MELEVWWSNSQGNKSCIFLFMSVSHKPFISCPQITPLRISGLKCQIFYRRPFKALIATENRGMVLPSCVLQNGRSRKAFIYGSRRLHVKYIARFLSLSCSRAVMISYRELSATNGAHVELFGPGSALLIIKNICLGTRNLLVMFSQCLKQRGALREDQRKSRAQLSSKILNYQPPRKENQIHLEI